MASVNAPCKGCEKRKLKCHSTCMDYLKYQGELYELKEKIYKDADMSRSIKENVGRMKRRYK